MDNIRFECEKRDFDRTVAFRLSAWRHGEIVGFVKSPLEITPYEKHEYSSETFNLSNDSTQELMDRLWSCGFRPSECNNQVNELSSVRYHLEDMRSLVFNNNIKLQKDSILRKDTPLCS